MLAVRALAALVLVALPACTTATRATIPEPLPEALPWSVPANGGAFLGLLTEENDSGSLDALYFEPGVRVVTVAPSSPAAAAGVLAGDVLVSLDGHAVNDPGALDALLAARAGGQESRLQVQRADTVFELTVLLTDAGGPREPPKELWRKDRTRSLAGWSTGGGGAVLVSAAPHSPVTSAGLPLGAVVLAVDGRETLSDRALIRTLESHEPGSSVELTWRAPSGGAERKTSVDLPDEPRVVTEFFIPLIVDYESTADGHHGSLELLDLYVVSLFTYSHHDGERRWVLLNLFGWDVFVFSSGVGELAP